MYFIQFFLVWHPDELRQALMPTLEKLYKQDPESIPFRQPVDPIVLQIPVRSHLYDQYDDVFFLLYTLSKFYNS